MCSVKDLPNELKNEVMSFLVPNTINGLSVNETLSLPENKEYLENMKRHDLVKQTFQDRIKYEWFDEWSEPPNRDEETGYYPEFDEFKTEKLFHPIYNETKIIKDYEAALEFTDNKLSSYIPILNEVQEYEDDNFGEKITSNAPEDVCNMWIYIQGKEYIDKLFEEIDDDDMLEINNPGFFLINHLRKKGIVI